jgi:SHS2 domain-containing protein
MGRTFFDHTGDVAVSLDSPTAAGLFREAALAFTDTLTDVAQVRTASSHRVELTAPALDDLMIEWLGELLYRFEVQNLLVADAEVELNDTDAGWALEGTIRGEDFDPGRHQVKVLVKGITYHRLQVVNEGGCWRTDVVFDI